MPIAPSGAVISIANTATESTICPQAKPIAIGTEPIAANTGYGADYLKTFTNYCYY